MLEEVEKRAHVSTTQEARRITQVVLRTLVSLMPREASHMLYNAVSETLKPTGAAAQPHVSTNVGELIETVAGEARCSPEQARHYIQAVFSTLADHDSRIADVLARKWPQELLHSPAVATAPHSNAAYGGPTVVDAQPTG